jgi:hypothetical protein
MRFEPGIFISRTKVGHGAKRKIYYVLQVLSCELVVFDLQDEKIRYVTPDPDRFYQVVLPVVKKPEMVLPGL